MASIAGSTDRLDIIVIVIVHIRNPPYQSWLVPLPPRSSSIHLYRYFDELVKKDAEYVEWVQGLASPGNALKELADFAREQEEAGAKKRKREGEDEATMKKCMICLERPLGACWVPCGHTTTCYECALGVAGLRCPICRKRGLIQKLFVG